MANQPEKYVCAHCGYTADGRFTGDICPQCGLTFWKCHCGYTITAATPPDTCPECGEKCEFVNVTCYTPECGCDESLTKEGCRLIFEKKLSGSRYLDSFDELHEMQTKG